MNSGIGGMSILSMVFFIMDVAMADMPGTAPSHVIMCMPGLPTVAILILLIRLVMIASNPKKVKNRLASMPSMRAPLAMIRPG